MGSRTTATLKDIEEIRSGLDRKLGEIESRFPAVGWGRKAAVAAAGSGALGSALLGWRLSREKSKTGSVEEPTVESKRRWKRKAEVASPAPAPVVVSALPKGLTLIALVGIAAWVLVRLYGIYASKNAELR